MANNPATLRPDIEAGLVWYFNQRHIAEVLPIETMIEWVRQMAEQRPLIVSARSQDIFRHPWNVQMNYDGDLWQFNVEPGMVADVDPYRWKDPDETSEVRYKAYIDEVEPPNFPITPDKWLKVGTDGDVGAGAVPDFFLNKEVLPPPDLKLAPDGTPVFDIDLPGPSTRLLRSCNLALIQPRPALSAVMTDLGLEINVIPAASNRASLSVTKKLPKTRPEPVSVVEQLTENKTDLGREELHLSTLYLLSPPGRSMSDDPPDGSWTAYVAHSVFWNLEFAVNQFIELIDPQALTLPTTLIGGVAIQQQLDVNNELDKQATALANRSEITGHFWTA